MTKIKCLHNLIEEISGNWFHTKTLSSLAERGFVRHLNHYPPYTSNWAGKPMPYERTADGAPMYEVELTTEGWDFIYRLDR